MKDFEEYQKWFECTYEAFMAYRSVLWAEFRAANNTKYLDLEIEESKSFAEKTFKSRLSAVFCLKILRCRLTN